MSAVRQHQAFSSNEHHRAWPSCTRCTRGQLLLPLLYLSSFFLRVEKSILACTLVHDPIRLVCNPATVRRVV